jgi:phosphoribosylformylglycinamidine synthase I
MRRRPEAAVLTAPGTNRDPDASLALELAGANPVVIPVASLLDVRSRLSDSDMIVIPGGFSYADALGAGRLFATELDHVLGDHLSVAAADRRPVIGICNGFQTLVRLGIWTREGYRLALGHNADGVFTCEWVNLVPDPMTRCIWTEGLEGEVSCPVAHGEGRVVCDDATASALMETGRVALRYVRNPNGSRGDIAGLTDATGFILGLMPHPENHVVSRQHPGFRRGIGGGLGLRIFENGVRHAGR